MLAKTFAGVLLGLPLAIALVAIVVWVWPGSSESVAMPALVSFFPVWTGIMGGTYMFHSGVRAWTWLVVANLVAFGALWAAKLTFPGL